MTINDLTPRRTLAEVIEIARDLALCADAAEQEIAWAETHGERQERALPILSEEALRLEFVAAHRAGQIDAMVAILTAHRAQTLRQVADGMIDLVGQRGAAVARVAVQPHFQGDLTGAGLADLDDLALAALDSGINQALAGVA